jgi:hypothetical protein
VPVVVAIAQQHVLGRAALPKPIEPFGGNHRVDQYSLRRKVMRTDFCADSFVAGRPMP